MSNAATLERPAAKPALVDNTVTAGAPLRGSLKHMYLGFALYLR